MTSEDTTPAQPTRAERRSAETGPPSFAEHLDAITLEDLRAQGSLKWSTYPGTIGMWVAEMDFGIAPELANAIEPAVDAGALGYLPRRDRTALREATAAFQRDRFGWDVDPEHVYLLPDVLSCLSAMIDHLVDADVPVIVPTPAYMPFLTWPASHGRRLVEVPGRADVTGRYALDLDALDAALAEHGGGLVVLCNPWNPVGRVLAREELLALAEVVERHGARVFADEIHAPLVLDDAVPHTPYASLDERTAAHTVTAVAASKGWNVPGLKCGQMILTAEADRAAFAPMAARHGDAVGLLGARAATAAYTAGVPWLDEVRAYLRGNRDLLASAVDGGRLPGVRPSPLEGSYIAWLDVRDVLGADAARFFREQAGVALTDGADCGEAGRGYLRMILATPRPILARAIEQMSAALAARG